MDQLVLLLLLGLELGAVIGGYTQAWAHTHQHTYSRYIIYFMVGGVREMFDFVKFGL